MLSPRHIPDDSILSPSCQQGILMQAESADPAPSWGRVDCLLDVLARLARLNGPRGQEFDINLVMQRSGIAQATFWRLITNRNERISLEPLARCCATLQIDITDLLVYRSPQTRHLCNPIPQLIPEPIGDSFGRIEVVLGEVLDGYASAFGEPLDDLTSIIQLPNLRQRVEALVAGDPMQGQIDLPVLERVIWLLTTAASKSSAPSHQFDSWLRERCYMQGTVSLVLRYVPPGGTN
jgi:DNA-binding Xre family transcriptional regulator